MGCHAQDKTGEAWSTFQGVVARRGERLHEELMLGVLGVSLPSQASFCSSINSPRVGQDE